MRDFVRYRQEHLTGDEKGEGQIFLEHLFQAFGHAGLRQAGAFLEARMRRRVGRRTSFADCRKPRVLIEMKKAGEPLGRHYEQALEYWFRAVPDRPRYVVLCNFDEFWVYDFNHQIEEPVDRLRLEELPRRWEALAFLLPEETRPAFAKTWTGRPSPRSCILHHRGRCQGSWRLVAHEAPVTAGSRSAFPCLYRSGGAAEPTARDRDGLS